ncbi:MAG: hypothetical protein ACI9UJ_000529 [bacterium]|jgi:hypothetical protein
MIADYLVRHSEGSTTEAAKNLLIVDLNIISFV